MAKDIIKRELWCDLSDDEVKDRKKQLAENTLQFVAWEDNRKAVLLPIDTEGKHLKQTRRKLYTAIDDKRELRDVECMWVVQGIQRVLIRLDNDGVVDQEPLSAEEIRERQQEKLPLEEAAPPAEAPPAEAPLAEASPGDDAPLTAPEEYTPPDPATALATTGPRRAEVVEGQFENEPPTLADDVQRVLRREGPLTLEQLCEQLRAEGLSLTKEQAVEALRRCRATCPGGVWHLSGQLQVLPAPEERSALPALPPPPRELLLAEIRKETRVAFGMLWDLVPDFSREQLQAELDRLKEQGAVVCDGIFYSPAETKAEPDPEPTPPRGGKGKRPKAAARKPKALPPKASERSSTKPRPAPASAPTAASVAPVLDDTERLVLGVLREGGELDTLEICRRAGLRHNAGGPALGRLLEAKRVSRTLNDGRYFWLLSESTEVTEGEQLQQAAE
jgi:hypothetical protein